MIRLSTRCLLSACSLIALTSCVSLKAVTVDRKTALENQILGTMQRMEPELILLSSTRGPATDGKSKSQRHRQAIEAALVRAFYRDDIDQLKDKQLVGEARGWRLAITQKTSAALSQLVERENQARDLLVQHLISLSPRLRASDIARVRDVLYRMQVANAQAGHRVQDEKGVWRTAVGKQAQPATDANQ
ncbi:MAG: DUF1318 domain-containing protein [Deltaproteobacteria bacterium]|nr:DUF1318 domain-containing protein [Deltaproteobacteria bacterium]